MRIPRGALAGGFAALLLTTVPSAAQQQIGYVSRVAGEWTLRSPGGGAVRVQRGMGVPAGAVLVPPRDYAREDYVAIVLANRDRVDRRCARAGECARPYALPARLRVRGPVERMIQGVSRWISDEPRRYVSLFSRGAGGWREAVVPLREGAVALEAVLRDAPAGRYSILFRRLDDPGAPPAGPVEVAWDAASSATVAVPRLAPGLYVAEGADTADPARAGTACVLVRGPDRYEADRARFEQAVGVAREWDPRVAPDGTREFLCAWLDLMSREDAGGHPG
jgi:hypothetical protein